MKDADRTYYIESPTNDARGWKPEACVVDRDGDGWIWIVELHGETINLRLTPTEALRLAARLTAVAKAGR